MWRAMIAAGLAAVSLTACGGSRVVGGENAYSYSRMEGIYAFSSGEALAEIHGDPFGGGPSGGGPFGGDRAGFVDRVVDAMQYRAPNGAARFVTRLQAHNPHGYRVVIVFNPGGDGLPGRICGPNRPVQPPVAGPPYRIYAEAAFCRGGGDLTTARGWLDEAKGPDDPQLRHLVGDLTSALFPAGEHGMDSCGGPDC